MVEIVSSFLKITEFSDAEELEIILATQDLIAHGKELNIAEYLEDDRLGGKQISACTSESEIKVREIDRTPRISRENTAWVVNCFRGLVQSRIEKIEMLQEQYSSVPSDLRNTSPEKVNYRLTRFILEAVKDDGNLYPGSSLYYISCGLPRHFLEELK